MMSNLRLSLLAASGIIAFGSMPTAQAVAQAVAQSPIQIIPANPTQNALPSPVDPALSEPALEPDLPAPASANPDSLESSETEPPSIESSAPLVEPAAAGETTNYSDGVMSIDFPADWKVDVSDDGLMITNVTTDEAGLVATQVARVAASPAAVVDANIDSFLKEGTVVGRYRSVTIDGQSALVMWLSDRPDTLSRAIATFIGYGNETVLLFSRYAPENATAEDDVLRLHTSYHNLSSDISAEPAASTKK